MSYTQAATAEGSSSAGADLLAVAGAREMPAHDQVAVSALLAVLSSVPSFARALLKPLDPPAGPIGTYADVRLQDNAGVLLLLDGAIVVRNGSSRWTCLVAGRTGTATIDPEQILRYRQIARWHHLNAVLTISNQISTYGGVGWPEPEAPADDDLRVTHLSWWKVFGEAVMQHRFRGVDGPEQAEILADLITYLADEEHGP